MREFLLSVGYDRWILPALLALPLVGAALTVAAIPVGLAAGAVGLILSPIGLAAGVVGAGALAYKKFKA